MVRIAEPKNVKLFEELGVLTAEECAARRTVMLTHYVGQVGNTRPYIVPIYCPYFVPCMPHRYAHPLRRPGGHASA